jgi:hypothetical protein
MVLWTAAMQRAWAIRVGKDLFVRVDVGSVGRDKCELQQRYPGAGSVIAGIVVDKCVTMRGAGTRLLDISAPLIGALITDGARSALSQGGRGASVFQRPPAQSRPFGYYGGSRHAGFDPLWTSAENPPVQHNNENG